MLSASTMTQLKKLESSIRTLLKTTSRTRSNDRQLSDCYRAVLRMHQDAFDSHLPKKCQPTNAQGKRLVSLARDAILYLGGESDPISVSLKDYDHNRYGPYLGISDEGSAAHIIHKAALESPKMQALGPAVPIVVGVAHDAERLGAIGEVPVGPEEYANIRLECVGRILTSTNVGTQLNLRYYKRYPMVIIQKGSAKQALRIAKHDLEKKFAPFLHTPDGKPRPLTVFIEFDRESRRTFNDRVSMLQKLAGFAANGKIADPKVHQLGFQVRIGFGYKGCKAALLAINLASAAGFSEVIIDGVKRKEADEKVSLPGLLNYLTFRMVDPILRRAREKGIRVHPKNSVDPDTVARNVWSALNSARHMGLELGKYGTFPLTLEECNEVIERVQHWFRDWTAAPVFFVDQGVLSAEKTYVNNEIVDGLKEWLKIMKHHKVPVVLIDTLDKSKGWRLLRTKGDPRGLLEPDQIHEIDHLASRWGIKVLWAGSISLPQAFEFGKMGVFGIYVTSAAASLGPVSVAYERDPLLASLKEPCIEGVSRAKLLLEAGFLVSRLQDSNRAEELEKLASLLIEAISQNRPEEEVKRAQYILFERAVATWKVYLKETNQINTHSSRTKPMSMRITQE